MRHLTNIAASAAIAATIGLSAEATPLCPEFRSADTMPSKYRKLAPVLSGSVSDWIITHDQMDEDYLPGEEARALLADIVTEFEARGVPLAIMMAPPRPVVAGQSVIDRLSGGTSRFDADLAHTSFSNMVVAAQEVGAIMPDLAAVALSDPKLRDTFYFRHDTHWTPTGAAESAIALAQLVAERLPETFRGAGAARPEVQDDGPVITEKGSLAKLAANVCGAVVSPVEAHVPVFPAIEAGLLGDGPELPRVALAGSSFSDRVKRDLYRVADALSGALDAEVVNYSVSGGGAIGAIEALILSGALDQEEFDLVIWEIPYTEGLRSTSMLRQLLGALRYDAGAAAGERHPLKTTGETKVAELGFQPGMLVLEIADSSVERVSVDVRNASGKKKTLKLIRKRRVPSEIRSDTWAVSLKDYPGGEISSLTIRYSPTEVSPASTVKILR